MAKYINKKASKWLKDLESGKFKQCREALFEPRNKSYGYCCLGVACATNGFKKDVEKDAMVHKKSGSVVPNGELPKEYLTKVLGLKDYSYNTLVHWNDEERLTFKQIAKKIRSNPGEIFNKL